MAERLKANMAWYCPELNAAFNGKLIDPNGGFSIAILDQRRVTIWFHRRNIFVSRLLDMIASDKESYKSYTNCNVTLEMKVDKSVN